jgi:hypothetical protein
MPIRVFILPFEVVTKKLTHQAIFQTLDKGGLLADHSPASALARQPAAVHWYDNAMHVV